MALYESEYTEFMREMKLKNPEWNEDQRVGFSLLWDKKVDLTEQQRLEEEKEPQRPYPYDVNFIE